MRALSKQGISRDSLPYKAPFQPYGSWIALIFTGIVIIFKGFDTFIPFTAATFITSYIGIPVVVILFIGYKIIYKTKKILAAEVDLVTGIRAFEEEEEEEESEKDQSRLRRIWNSI